jgi:cell division septation protein DedD
VSEPEDRSYYEISLTNGQVLVAFVALLACVLGAFVSGMWVAREAMGPATPPPSAHAEDSAAGDTLEFFGEGGSAAAEPVDQPAGVPEDEPAIQQVKPLPSPAPARPEAEPGPQARASEAPADRSPEARAPDTDRREPVGEPAEPSAPGAERSAPAPGPDAAPAPGPGFVIQVFSSIDEAQADALLSRLRSSGYTAFRNVEQVGGRTVYRVRVGPYPERSQAESEAAKLKRQFKVETWITSSG